MYETKQIGSDHFIHEVDAGGKAIYINEAIPHSTREALADFLAGQDHTWMESHIGMSAAHHFRRTEDGSDPHFYNMRYDSGSRVRVLVDRN